MAKKKLKEDVMIAARASSVDELQRLLHLAGVGGGSECGEQEGPVVHLVQSQQPAFEAIKEDVDEGWLDKEAPPGVERYKVGDPNDTIDVEFGDETIADQEEDVDEEAGEPAEYDFGHDEGIMQQMDPSGLDRTPRGRSAVRYTPARHADNPLLDDDDPTSQDEAERGEYDKAVDDTAKRAPRGQPNNFVDRESKRLAAKFNLEPESVGREIKDQMVLYNKGPMKEHLEESIGVLIEDSSDELASALRKIRHRLYENLTDEESAHLAAAFINLMRNDDSAHVAHVHQMFQTYVGEADVARAYDKFKKRLS